MRLRAPVLLLAVFVSCNATAQTGAGWVSGKEHGLDGPTD
jgi:hypothetical protein